MATGQDVLEAIKAGDAAKMADLLAADPALAAAHDESGNSAVLLAAYYGRKDIVDLLLANVAELNLFEASAVGDTERVAALLAEDPDLVADLVNAYAHDGFTPLGLASFFGHLDLVALLLQKGAQVNAASQNKMRVMPLHSALANRHTDIAETLIAHGADVNAAQQDGYTPLHEAAHNGQDELIALLLANGANVNARKDDGKTALTLALENGQAEAAELLRQSGGTE